MNDFGKQLKSIRKSKGLSLNELSERTYISAAQLSRIENGQRGIPKPETMKLLAKGLDVPYEELMTKAGYFVSDELSQDDIEALKFYRDNADLFSLLMEMDSEKLNSLYKLLK